MMDEILEANRGLKTLFVRKTFRFIRNKNGMSEVTLILSSVCLLMRDTCSGSYVIDCSKIMRR